MKKILSALLVFALIFPVIMTASAPNVFGQKRKKVCYYTDTTVRRKVPKGCGACARLLKVEQDIAILMAKKPDEKKPGDAAELAKLQKEFDDLLPRVEKLEEQMKKAQDDILGLQTETGALRTDLNIQTARTDGLEVRVTGLEGQCKIQMLPTGKKGKLEMYWVCPGAQPVLVKTNNGLSTGAKIAIGAGFVFTGLCVFGVGGLCRGGGGGGGRPPIGTTGPSF